MISFEPSKTMYFVSFSILEYFQHNFEYFQYFQKLSIVDFMCSAMLSFKDLLLMGFSSIIMSHCGGSVPSRKQRPENSSGTILPELFSGRRPLCTSAICIGSSVWYILYLWYVSDGCMMYVWIYARYMISG